MTLGSDEVETPADRLTEALVNFTSCVGTSLTGICSYGLTIGETYVPFDPDPEDECEEEDSSCEQAWVRVMSANTKDDPNSQGWQDGGCAVVMVLELEVGVLRCIELKDKGEAPTVTEVLGAAMQSMEDMLAIHKAAMDCNAADGQDLWLSIEDGQWQPSGPLGGQYGGTWTFTVEFDPQYQCSED